MFKNEINKQGKKQGVEISHDDEADDGGDDADKFDALVRSDAGGDIIGDSLILHCNDNASY